MDSINICYQAELPSNPGLSGKVLVKFQIGMDGGVANVSTRSTSLRNEAVETCVNAEVTKVKFPPLERGRLAIVHYPFVFPLPQATN
jgi:TonB family protein